MPTYTVIVNLRNGYACTRRGKEGKMDEDNRNTEQKDESEEDRLGELRVLIENVWREYRNLQDEYHKLTEKDYGWLR